MEVSYQRPVKTETGEYLFEKYEKSYCDIKYFKSKKELDELQEEILDATASVIDSLRNYELPTGVDGKAQVKFELYKGVKKKIKLVDSKRERILCSEVVGDIGFPNIAIETNLGDFGFPDIVVETSLDNSGIVMNPEVVPSRKLFGSNIVKGILIKLNGNISENVLKEKLNQLGTIFNTPTELMIKDNKIIIPFEYELKIGCYSGQI